jgi:allene oxide cyclase
MFRNRWVVACATVALLIGGAVMARASGERDGGRRIVITVVERAVSDTVTDVGPAGDSPGDLLTFVNPVFDKENERRVGHDEGSCIRVSSVRGVWDCSFTTFLEGGQIRVSGPFYDERDSAFAITGGTGQYKTAHGTMLLLHGENAAEFGFVFRIII